MPRSVDSWGQAAEAASEIKVCLHFMSFNKAALVASGDHLPLPRVLRQAALAVFPQMPIHCGHSQGVPLARGQASNPAGGESHSLGNEGEVPAGSTEKQNRQTPCRAWLQQGARLWVPRPAVGQQRPRRAGGLSRLSTRAGGDTSLLRTGRRRADSLPFCSGLQGTDEARTLGGDSLPHGGHQLTCDLVQEAAQTRPGVPCARGPSG